MKTASKRVKLPHAFLKQLSKNKVEKVPRGQSRTERRQESGINEDQLELSTPRKMTY